MQTPKKSQISKLKVPQLHVDCALFYRGVRVYHTLRDLAAGRQNATCNAFWFTWQVAGRNSDDGHPSQFDIRSLQPPASYRPALPSFRSVLLSEQAVRQLQYAVDRKKGLKVV